MKNQSFRRGLLAALALAATGASALADPLETLLAKSNGSACFERIYDETHLQKHPGQRTREMLFSLRTEGADSYSSMRIAIKLTKNSSLYVQGACAFTEQANLDVMGEKLIEAFKGPAGLDCHAYASTDPGSAEEGGDFPVDLRDGKAIVVYFPDGLAAWPSLPRKVEADFVDFGTEDQVFKLNRTSNAPCRQLVQDLPSMD